MRPPAADPAPIDDPAIRDIPRWADRYARSRTLAGIPFLLMVIAASLTILVPLLLALWAHDHQRPELPLYIIATAVAYAFWLWAGWTRRVNVKASYAFLTRWLYVFDGEVVSALRPTPDQRGSRSGTIPFVALLLAFIAMPVIAQAVDLPLQYRQPLIAAYMVPLLTWLLTRRGVEDGPVMLLWPGLYALHAILLLAGVPLPAPQQPMVNVYVPLMAYLVVAIIATHIYGRYALRRLRRLVHSPETSETEGETHA